MSNDLISRSALLKALEEKVYPEKYGEKCNALDVINGVLQVIGEQSTAYDVGKVLSKLEEAAQDTDDYLKTRVILSESFFYDGKVSGLDIAIAIVKSGGIE